MRRSGPVDVVIAWHNENVLAVAAGDFAKVVEPPLRHRVLFIFSRERDIARHNDRGHWRGKAWEDAGRVPLELATKIGVNIVVTARVCSEVDVGEVQKHQRSRAVLLGR